MPDRDHPPGAEARALLSHRVRPDPRGTGCVAAGAHGTLNRASLPTRWAVPHGLTPSALSHWARLRRLEGMNHSHSSRVRNARSPDPTPPRQRIGTATRRTLHHLGGSALALFALLHLGNHLVALTGVPAHQQALEWLRLFYRHPWVELPLLLVLASQMVSGAAGAWTVLRHRGPAQRLPPRVRWQAVSGLVLGSFVLIHVAAVLTGRFLLQLDTNFHFAAAGLYTPWAGFFAAYYFLGVTALGVHLGCAAGRHIPPVSSAFRRAWPWLIGLSGMALAALLVALLAGWWVPVNVPAHYLNIYPV